MDWAAGGVYTERVSPRGTKKRPWIRGLPLSALVLLLFLAGWLAELGIDRSLPAPPHSSRAAPDLAPLELPGGELALRGRILGPGGQPMAGASVSLREGQVPFWTATDEDGRFELRGLSAGLHRLSVVSWPHPPATFEVAAGGEELDLRLPRAFEPIPDLPLASRADLLGRIEAPPGRDAGGWGVRVEPTEAADVLGPALPRCTRTDSGGHFHLPDLVHGTYRLAVLPPWASTGTWPNLLASSHRILEHGGGEGQPPRAATILSLPLAIGELSGHATDTQGDPVEGASLLLHATGDPNRLWPPAVTDERGRFRIGDLTAGAYSLELRAGEAALEAEVHVGEGSSSVRDFEGVAVSGGEGFP